MSFSCYHLVSLPLSCHVLTGIPLCRYPGGETSCPKSAQGTALCKCPYRVWVKQRPIRPDHTGTEFPLRAQRPLMEQQKIRREDGESNWREWKNPPSRRLEFLDMFDRWNRVEWLETTRQGLGAGSFDV